MRGARDQNKRAAKVQIGLGSNAKPGRTGESVRAQVEKDEKASLNELQDPHVAVPNTKIKLQLYPVDEVTRIGLVESKIHPYLELILRPTKRISSVLKHIDNKWGCSNVALGEPFLLPYNIHGDISSCRTWTMKDSDIRAVDVYAFIGRPTTFRLRYGWVSTPEDNKTFEEPSTPAAPHNNCLQSKDVQTDCITNEKNPDQDEDDEVRRTDIQNEQSATPWLNEITNISMGVLLFEESLQAKLTDKPISTENNTDTRSAQTSVVPQWADSLIDISIGGLFSEASLQGKYNNETIPKNTGNADSTHNIFSDSLDAFISAQTRYPQGPKPPSHESSQTFIFDGEETCHAFPVPKFSSSGKRVLAIGGGSGSCSQDSGSRSLKFQKLNEINNEAGVTEDRPCQDSRIDHILSPRTYNNENSLGLANLTWAESLGPFDLGLSASRKLIKEEKRQQSDS